jgi:hypothetical protein
LQLNGSNKGECMKNYIGLILGVASFLSVQATTVVESFDYATGTLEGQNGGVGFAGAWSSASGYTITSPGLDYAGIINGAAGLKADTVGGTAFAKRALSDTWGADGTTFYVSAILQKTIADDATRYWGLNLYGGGAQKAVLGQTSGYDKFVVTATTGGSIGTPVNSQIETLLLVRFDFAAGGSDTMTVWINPDFSLTESANTAALVGTKTVDIGLIDEIRMGGGSANDTQAASSHIVDEIRLSTDTPFSTALDMVVESFDYTESSLDGQSGGSGFASGWANAATYTVTTPGLNHSDITNGAAGLKASSIGFGGAARRTLADVWGTDGTTFYVGALLQKTVEDDNTRYWGLQLYNAAWQQKLLLGQGSGASYFQVSVTGEGSLTSATSSQTESFLLIRVDAAAGTNDTITFWVDPDLSKAEEQNTPVGVLTGFDLGEITQIRMGGGDASESQAASSNVVDEIRISSRTLFGPWVEPEIIVGEVAMNMVGGTNLVFNWQGMESATYTVQTRESLVSGSWSNVTENIEGIDGAMSVSNTMDAAQGFFRMVAE